MAEKSLKALAIAVFGIAISEGIACFQSEKSNRRGPRGILATFLLEARATRPSGFNHGNGVVKEWSTSKIHGQTFDATQNCDKDCRAVDARRAIDVVGARSGITTPSLSNLGGTFLIGYHYS